jgi:hypothetical protein
MCGMNIPVNGIEIRCGQELKNLLLKFQRSSCRSLYKTRPIISTTHTSLVDFRFLGDTRSKNLKIKLYRTIILPFVLYGCEAWSLTLREERRLKVFENRVLRRVFGPKKDEVTGEWR